jgi:glycosyltransferase involved in cell wall biosynthesis
MTKFTVVIPCYNERGHIEQALNSVFDQYRKSEEVIVVDDGSNDGSREVVENYPQDVRLLRTDHANAAGARNVGLNKANGDWIAFLDADDFWYEDHLGRVEELIRSDDRIVGVLNHHDVEYPDSEEIVTQPRKIDCRSTEYGLEDTDYLAAHAKSLGFAGMSACCVKRKRALEIGGFREDFFRRHDIEFWLRLIQNHRWSWDSKATSVYRKHRKGSLSDQTAKARVMHLKAFTENRQYKGYDDYAKVIQRLSYKAWKGLIKYSDIIYFGKTSKFVFKKMSPLGKIIGIVISPLLLYFPVYRLIRNKI